MEGESHSSNRIARRPFLVGTAALAAGAVGSQYGVGRVAAASADSLGNAVDVDFEPKLGAYYLVGAPGDNDVRPNAGAVYVFRRKTSPIDVSKLTAADGEVGDRFGHAVTLDAYGKLMYAFAGAPGESEKGNNAGAVYAFQGKPSSQTSWTQQSKITAADGTTGDEFGSVLTNGGDRIVVGAPGADGNTGAVYVLDYKGTQVYKLVASDGASADRFGAAVATDGKYFLVGAPGSGNTGAAYLFSGSKQVAKIVPPDAAGGDRVGAAVAVGKTHLAIGAPQAASADGETGLVYVYRHRKPTLLATISPLDGSSGDRFGAAVDSEGSYILVGEPGGSSGGGGNAGAVHLYNTKGTRLGTFTANDADQGDNLGITVAMAADQIIAGSPGDDDVASNSGAAYIFELQFDPLLTKFTG